MALIGFVLLLSCNKDQCSVKKTQVNTYLVQDSIYSPTLLEWIPQSYELTLSYCTKSPENLRLKYLNTVDQDIYATKEEGGVNFTIEDQAINHSLYQSVSGSGSVNEESIQLSYSMITVEDVTITGKGSGVLK